MINFTDSICQGHLEGLEFNRNSYIIGLGVNYKNGADGTTTGLASKFPMRLLDTPVSEAAVTGMCVGMAASGMSPIVHHGRVEFALLAMDQILTQAAKWNFMFGGDYPCPFGARLNIGRQWGNGPQHTSSYNSLFLNTPGLDVFWPSRPSEAYFFTSELHKIESPTLQMEHRWLFKTFDLIKNAPKIDKVPSASLYEAPTNKNVIITYGDGLVEALKVKEAIQDTDISVICLTSFCGTRILPNDIIEIISSAKNLILLDTSNFEFGLLQALTGKLAIDCKLPKNIIKIAPPFTPVATAANLVKNYYPTSPEICKILNKNEITECTMVDYDFDQINLPPTFDFSQWQPKYFQS